MDLDQFNAEHPALQPANDDNAQWARDYDWAKREIDAFISDEVWRKGGLL